MKARIKKIPADLRAFYDMAAGVAYVVVRDFPAADGRTWVELIAPNGTPRTIPAEYVDVTVGADEITYQDRTRSLLRVRCPKCTHEHSVEVNAARILGSMKKTVSPKSIAARKVNGAKGGRPRKVVAE